MTTHREALQALDTLRLSPDDVSALKERLSAAARRHNAIERDDILEEARRLDADRREAMTAKYVELIARGRAAMLIDSAYVVAIAEEAAAIQRRAEYRDDPERQKADALRLHSQGASLDEIQRTVRMTSERLRVLLKDAPERAQPTSSRTKRTDSPTPTQRPVAVRYVEPTKQAAAPKNTRAEGIGQNRTYADEQPRDNRPHSGRTHGLISTYTKTKNYPGCRCEACCDGAREFWRGRWAKKNAQQKK